MQRKTGIHDQRVDIYAEVNGVQEAVHPQCKLAVPAGWFQGPDAEEKVSTVLSSSFTGTLEDEQSRQGVLSVSNCPAK